jgi:hypothetical protein
MQCTFDITDEKQLEQVQTLRGDRSAEEFIAVCFEQGLKLAEFQRRQKEAHTAAEVTKHPLLQFPEAKPEFKNLDEAAVTEALKQKNLEDPVTAEVTRLASAYMAQVNEYARQHGNRLPAAMHVTIPRAIIEKAAFHLAATTIKSVIQRDNKTAVAA